VPTLSVGGWYDVFATGTVSLHRAMRARDAEPGRHRLIVGPWTHSGVLPQIQGELNTGLSGSALGSRLPAAHLEFFDRHLRSPGTEAARPAESDTAAVRYFLMGADEWREADDWPVHGASEIRWYLDSDGDARTAAGSGRLLPKPDPGGSRFDGYRYDPHEPVPSHGGRVLHLGGLVGGPLDQGRLEARNDVLCYTSPVLDRPLDAIGRHRVRLFFSSSAPDTDVVAKLVDAYPDGRALIVAEGSLRLRYREGFDRETPLTPGEVVEVRIELGDCAWRFAPGHRLRLDVTSSNFPHLDRNLNTGDPIGLTTRTEVADQRVWHGVSRPSCLELQVLDADAREAR
jgi:putative CocE/NonD family hydrolase